MAETVTVSGDVNKDIKSVGELALRISMFDSYRLFTLYENANERKRMDVSGNQKYYLVFKSPKKEIRIPEYDPKGNFEVDKVNGCILFKITKKNAEDIISMKTAGDKIFHIIRVYEERDAFGKVLNVTDEVEVYNGKWGTDSDFSAFSTDNLVQQLISQIAVLNGKNATLLKDYNDLFENYTKEVNKNAELEQELITVRAERDSLQAQIDEYNSNTYDGTVLSTDTKYIAFENSMENVSFTEEQFNDAMNDLMTKGEIDMSNYDFDEPRIELEVKVLNSTKGLKLNAYQNEISIGSAIYDKLYYETVYINHGDKFKFECEGVSSGQLMNLHLMFEPISGDKYVGAVTIEKQTVAISPTGKTTVTGVVNFMKEVEDEEGNLIDGKFETEDINAVGNIGKLICYIK